MHSLIEKHGWNPLRALLAAAAVATMATGEAARAGGPIVDVGGFESFSSGSVIGQQGWDQRGPLTSTAEIQSTVALSGSNALYVTRAPNASASWAVKHGGFPTGRFVSVSWDMRVDPSSGNALGPIFGVDTHDGFGPGNSTPYYTLIGTLAVDARTGDVLYQVGGSGALATAGTVALGAWNHFEMLMDFSNHTYRNFVNGMQVSYTPFVDPSPSNPNVINEFTDADITTFEAFGDAASQAMTGSAFFDNFLVTDGLLGDFDEDADVDAADLTTWRTAYGVNGAADATGDHLSRGEDFLIWQRRKGIDLIPATAALESVPEPAAALLAALAIAGVWLFQRS